jgi:hypothetical protein
MTVGGWPLTGKAHIGDDHALAHAALRGVSAAWNVLLRWNHFLWARSGLLTAITQHRCRLTARRQTGSARQRVRSVTRMRSSLAHDGLGLSSADGEGTYLSSAGEEQAGESVTFSG